MYRLQLLNQPFTRTLDVKLAGEESGPWRSITFNRGVARVKDERLARHLVRAGYCIPIDNDLPEPVDPAAAAREQKRQEINRRRPPEHYLK